LSTPALSACRLTSQRERECGRALSLSLSLTGKEDVCWRALWRKREKQGGREKENGRERNREGERKRMGGREKENGRERNRERQQQGGREKNREGGRKSVREV
jgi:hypothetical protein